MQDDIIGVFAAEQVSRKDFPKSDHVRHSFLRASTRLCKLVEERTEILHAVQVKALVAKFARFCAKRQWDIDGLTGDLPSIADAIAENPENIVNSDVTLKKMVDLHQVHNRQVAAELRRTLLSDLSADVPPDIIASVSCYCLVECRTQRHLRQETACLGHCVGGTHLDYYAGKMARGDTRIFSLRSLKGVCLATIEYDTRAKTIVQIEGEHGMLSGEELFFPALCQTLYGLSQKIPIEFFGGLPEAEGKILTKDGGHESVERIAEISPSHILAGTVDVDDATTAPILECLAACPRLALDVTGMSDLSRLLVRVQCVLTSHADVFKAPKLQECRAIDVSHARQFVAPRLEVAGDIWAPWAVVFRIPKLRIAGNIDCDDMSSFIAPNLQIAGNLSIPDVAVCSIPRLQRAGCVEAHNVPVFNASRLEVAGNLNIVTATRLRLPRLRKAGCIDCGCATRFVVPQLQISGTIEVGDAMIFVAPRLRTVLGHIDAESATRFEAPQLKKCEYVLAGCDVPLDFADNSGEDGLA